MVYCFNFDWDKIFSLSKKIKRNNLKVLKTVRRIDIMKLKLRCLCLTKTALKKILFQFLLQFFFGSLIPTFITFLSFPTRKTCATICEKKQHTDLFLFAELFLSQISCKKYQSSPQPPPPKKKLPLTNIFQVAERLFSIQINHR